MLLPACGAWGHVACDANADLEPWRAVIPLAG